MLVQACLRPPHAPAVPHDLFFGKPASPHHSSPSDGLTCQWHEFRGARHTIKIQAVVGARGLPIRLGLTPGRAHDGPAAYCLLDRLDPRTRILADKAYDADSIRNLIEAQGAMPNIPAKSNRKWKPCFSKWLYPARNLIEHFFSKIERLRRIATRYDKLAENFLAMALLASTRLWLRAYDSTA